MKLAFLTAALILIGGTLIYLQSVKAVQSAEIHLNSPYVLTSSRYRKNTPAKSETTILMVNSRGESLLRRIGRDGSDVEHFVQRFSAAEWKGWSGGKERYERSAHVIRKEQIVGLTAYVYRQAIGSGQILERWYSPETGPIPLKEILESSDADALITEATSIEFREVSDEEMKPQDNLSRDYPQL